nr:hypothetical protein [Valsa mali var. pyri (nom. inval.)]
MFFPTCKLLKKPSKDCKIKVSTTLLVIYTYDDKQLAIKENKGKFGVYRWVNTLTGDTYVGSAVSLSKRFSVYYSTKSVNEVLSRSPPPSIRRLRDPPPTNFVRGGSIVTWI